MELEQTHGPVSELASDLTLPCLIHDLNNVFQTLVEAADLLSTDPRWASLSAVILRSVERGKTLTSGFQSVDQPSDSFDNILDNAITFVEDSLIAGRRLVRFIRDVEPGLHLQRVWAWDRVLINLFSNAVYAMPKGGTISVHARRVLAANSGTAAHDGIEQEGGKIEIVVSDDGPGIAPEVLEDLFKPHVTTKPHDRELGMRGLGLHIVQTIVRQQSGDVRVVNLPGRGAEFTITIPAGAGTTRPAHA